MCYHHITRDERVKIEAYLRAGLTQAAMARALDRAPSTISQELKRGHGADGRYHAGLAERERRAVRTAANQQRRKITAGSPLLTTIITGLTQYWSPEQIVGRMRTEGKPDDVCHETIYRWLYTTGREFLPYLRCQKGKYRRRYGTKIREIRREEAKKKRIDTRPAIVEARERLGDWEGDTVVGKEKTVHILTHVDRKSGLLLADKIDVATAEEVRKIIVDRFAKVPKKKRHTITYDNGVQFAEHESIERDARLTVYFAYPYHSWERGTNENTNGLLRQFFPKGSFFRDVTKKQIDRAVKFINTRPRKRLAYRTPLEVFGSVAV